MEVKASSSLWLNPKKGAPTTASAIFTKCFATDSAGCQTDNQIVCAKCASGYVYRYTDGQCVDPLQYAIPTGKYLYGGFEPESSTSAADAADFWSSNEFCGFKFDNCWKLVVPWGKMGADCANGANCTACGASATNSSKVRCSSCLPGYAYVPETDSCQACGQMDCTMCHHEAAGMKYAEAPNCARRCQRPRYQSSMDVWDRFKNQRRGAQCEFCSDFDPNCAQCSSTGRGVRPWDPEPPTDNSTAKFTFTGVKCDKCREGTVKALRTKFDRFMPDAEP